MLVHKESKSVILKLRDPSRVTNYIPNARFPVYMDGVDSPLLQVKFGLDEARVLRNVGISVPSPIRYFYSFPIRAPHKPFDHQVITSEFFTFNDRCICLNDMGTGKTLSVLWALDYLMELGLIRKAIVTCPKSTVNSVWAAEVTTHFLAKRTVAVLTGDKVRRQKLLATDADIYVVNHDGIKVIADDLRARKDIDLWVVDEADAFRNATSKRHKLLASLVKPTNRLWLLTGTPLPKDPTDAWGLARLMHGARVQPSAFETFKNQTMMQITQYKWVAKPGATERAYQILQPGIRFKKEDCIDLPPITFQTHVCGLSADQQAAYKAMISTLVADVRGIEITAANAAVKATKLLQICLGQIYDEFGQGHLIDSQERLDLCADLVSRARNKVIIFVPFTQALDSVAAHLRKRWTVATVDGRTSDSQRKVIFSDFQNATDPHILVAHPETASHGLNLTAADMTIWYGPITKMGVFEQANNRMNRPNQKFNMTVALIASTMLEQNLYSALKNKQDVMNSVLNMFKAELGI